MKRLLSGFLLLAAGLFAAAVHPVTGRPIAQVMGIGGADWLARSEREAEEAPDRALNALEIQPGQTVADVGAGVGYFTWRLAARVGPTGRVYANDIQKAMLQKLEENMAGRGLKNVVPVLGTITDARLPAGKLDLVLLVDVYHEFSEPQAMLRSIHSALKPGGRLVLIEYRAEDPKIPIRPEHKMSLRLVRNEVEPEGFRFDKNIEVLPRQHIVVFRTQP